MDLDWDWKDKEQEREREGVKEREIHGTAEKQRREYKRAMTRTYCAIHVEFSSWEMYNEIIGKPEPWLSTVYLH